MRNPWLLRFPPRPGARLRLLCLPGAGSAAAMYRSWAGELPDDVEVCAVQLPGRAGRLRETPFTAMDPLADALAEAVVAELDRPTVVFGHSLGSLVGYEMACRLRDAGADGQLRELMVAAHRPPRLGSAGLAYHRLPTEQLMTVMAGLGGTPAGVLARPDLVRLAEPAMRADFEVDYTYRHREREPLSLPVSVFGGTGDATVCEAELAQWRTHTTAEFTLRMLPGDHFFHEGPSRAELLSLIGARLLRHV
ncbi:alpha/beta fold hydrolase [Streptomyces sp. ICBB 8177]|uniref:thioesterase II family protein n=1 Tax=Streptomyces sp. ICBB 8177 TaxID=563922 RepID=UPI000D674854|nr:alpha/beta fold hydrolase [Streptomyces sp. ICBB 8177]PWI44916.1 thioesterase [Streptomyces sp. ICBB 8177]